MAALQPERRCLRGNGCAYHHDHHFHAAGDVHELDVAVHADDADLGSTLKLIVFASNNAAPDAAPRESPLTQPARGGPLNLAGAPNGLPALTGTAARGQTMTATSGLWSGFPGTQPPLTITHQWQRCPLDGNLANCVPVNANPPIAVLLTPAGAQTCSSLAPCGGSSQYVLSDADLGFRLRAR